MIYNQSQSQIADDSFLRDIFLEMQRLTTEITTSIMFAKTKSQLADADKVRNEAIRSFAGLIKGYSTMRLEKISAPAKRLRKIFNKYGVNVTRKNYDAKSSLIDSLLGDLAADDVRNDINQLQYVADVISDIREAEVVFKQKIVEYDSCKCRESKVEPATNLRRQLLELINNRLIGYLLTMEMMKNEKYYKFIGEIEEAVNRTNNEIRAHSKNDVVPESESDESGL